MMVMRAAMIVVEAEASDSDTELDVRSVMDEGALEYAIRSPSLDSQLSSLLPWSRHASVAPLHYQRFGSAAEHEVSLHTPTHTHAQLGSVQEDEYCFSCVKALSSLCCAPAHLRARCLLGD